jgi:hypothetical protein
MAENGIDYKDMDDMFDEDIESKWERDIEARENAVEEDIEKWVKHV